MTGEADPSVRTHLRLQAALERRFFGAGWVRDETIDRSIAENVAAFRRPIGDRLVLTALFDRGTDKPLPFKIGVSIGIAHTALDRLWPVFTGEPPEDVIFHGLTGFQEGITVRGEQDVETAAETLTDTLLSKVESYVRKYGSVDAILAANRGPDIDLDTEMYVVPGLLAVAGRFEDARAALVAYQPSRVRALLDRVLDPEHDYRRFTERLTWWLDSGGDAE